MLSESFEDEDVHETIPLQQSPTDSAPIAPSPHQLSGKLGALDAFSTIISSIIGSGIFATPGLVFAGTGSPCASIAAWVLSGLLGLLGTLCYVELATGNIDCGAEAVYFCKAFHRSISFCFVVVSFFALVSGSIAIESTVFAQYFLAMFGIESRLIIVPFALAVIAFLTYLNLKDCQQSAQIQRVMVFFKIAAVMFLVIGVSFSPKSSRNGVQFTNLNECFAGSSPATFGLGVLDAAWTYSGFNSISALSEEFSNPRRDLPVGAVSGMIVVVFLYVIANISVYGFGFG